MFDSNVVTDIPNHIEAGWRFYTKCYNGKSACLGCCFKVEKDTEDPNNLANELS